MKVLVIVSVGNFFTIQGTAYQIGEKTITSYKIYNLMRQSQMIQGNDTVFTGPRILNSEVPQPHFCCQQCGIAVCVHFVLALAFACI